MSDLSEKNSLSPLKRWLEQNKNQPNLAESLKKLLAFACAEWVKKSGIVLTPENALAKVVAANLPEYSLGEWLDLPLQFAVPIVEFCEKIKTMSLPDSLADVPKVLDLRGVKCPSNAARSRLVLATLPKNSVLQIYLDQGSPIENVPSSLVADGHFIKKREKKENFWIVTVVKGTRSV